MFERFTDRARRVVVLAQEEARMLNHDYIGTEHIFLGLIHEGEGVAAAALESLGVSMAKARDQVREIIGQGEVFPSGHLPFTPRAKKVLELSLREALQLGHSYIGTEHILLGLIREGEGVGAQVLIKLGASLDRAREEVIRLLEGGVVDTEDVPREPAEPPGFPLSSKGRAVLALADEFAATTGQRQIQPAHLLMGLIGLSVKDSAVRQMLEELGMDLQEIQRRIEGQSSGSDGDEGSTEET